MSETVNYDKAVEVLAEIDIDIFTASAILAEMFNLRKEITVNDILKYRKGL